ncbi:metallophosphoesterase family protein [Methylocapsa palsarum]|uniref:3',5'-cyclic AMP phosphodiesterase CpdA n=1 Tax=Methylocapsa palsarum TaxID=1612308 RepID=A0A1I4ANJ4_9HYPH|nr:metallophosphoesterase [Methylocapsa palsarum]SFK58078.1 3',5'-cyclic AMP phosphodiesterase CpdA [Methylocapsa palsarum]
MTIRLVHLSDVHFGAEDREASESAVVMAHSFSPDAVIVSGDVTAAGRPREFRQAQTWLARLPSPRFVTPGNHDVPYWNLPLRIFAPFARYHRFIGPVSVTAINLPGLAVRGVNTSRGAQFRSDWSKGAVNLDALRQSALELKAAATALKVLVCHHPLIEARPTVMTGGVYRAAAASVLLAQAGIDLILTGHVHDPFAVSLQPQGGRTYAIGAGTLSLRSRGAPPSYSTIEADALSIKIQAWGWTGSDFEPFKAWLLPRRNYRNNP